MIDSADVQRFLDLGATTIDTPLTRQQIEAAVQALDRLLPQREGSFRSSATCNYDDAALLEIIQHPFFEQVACQVLDTDAVHFLQTAIITAYPQPGVDFSFDQHIDMQYTLSDLQSSPRRVVCSYFLWLTDVTPDRAPMMFRPASHLPLATHWATQPDLVPLIPRVHGIKLADLPDFDYAEPEPLLARAGQVSVLTTGMVHGASINTGRAPRKALVMTYHAAVGTCGLPAAQEEAKIAYDSILRQRLRPERAHIVRPAPASTAQG